MPDIQYIRPSTEQDLQAYPAPGEMFHLLADYGRHVMEIYVPITDDSIWIAPIDTAWVAPQKTKGRIHRHAPIQANDLEDDTNGDVDLAEFTALVTNSTLLSPLGICMAALHNYVIPRAVALMARVYLPKPITEVDDYYAEHDPSDSQELSE